MTTEQTAVTHTRAGTTVTVTVKDGGLSVRWAVKTYPGRVGEAAQTARQRAHEALEAVRAHQG